MQGNRHAPRPRPPNQDCAGARAVRLLALSGMLGSRCKAAMFLPCSERRRAGASAAMQSARAARFLMCPRGGARRCVPVVDVLEGECNGAAPLAMNGMRRLRRSCAGTGASTAPSRVSRSPTWHEASRKGKEIAQSRGGTCLILRIHGQKRRAPLALRQGTRMGMYEPRRNPRRNVVPGLRVRAKGAPHDPRYASNGP